MDLINPVGEVGFYHEIIECLTEALEARDPYTRGHSQRVAHMAKDIAHLYGLSHEQIELIHIAGHLHDIGKIGIPDDILNKPGTLTDAEYEIIKKHSEIGYKILSKSENLNRVAQIVLKHHERWDGRGYPLGLMAEEIPIEARILCLSDSIDAMRIDRIYKKAISLDACKAEVRRCSGTQFDPRLVELIEVLWNKWELEADLGVA